MFLLCLLSGLPSNDIDNNTADDIDNISVDNKKSPHNQVGYVQDDEEWHGWNEDNFLWIIHGHGGWAEDADDCNASNEYKERRHNPKPG